MATAKERVISTQEKIVKKELLIKKYENQIAKMTSDIVEKGWNPDDRYCRLNQSDYNESYWSICELSNKKEALKSAQDKLQDLEKVLEGWKVKAQKEEEKGLIVREMPEVFNELKKQISDIWFNWDISKREAVRSAYAEYKKKCAELPKFDNFSEKMDAERKIRHELIDDVFLRSEIALRYMKDAEIRKNADKSAESTIMDLYYRVLHVTGKIISWKNVSLHTGVLNGFFTGEEGTARVESVEAGGWNIQRWHLRALVHEIK